MEETYLNNSDRKRRMKHSGIMHQASYSNAAPRYVHCDSYARMCLLEQRVTNEVMVKKGKNDKSARVDKTQETRVNKKNAREEIKPSTDEYPRT